MMWNIYHLQSIIAFTNKKKLRIIPMKKWITTQHFLSSLFFNCKWSVIINSHQFCFHKNYHLSLFIFERNSLACKEMPFIFNIWCYDCSECFSISCSLKQISKFLASLLLFMFLVHLRTYRIFYMQYFCINIIDILLRFSL